MKDRGFVVTFGHANGAPVFYSFGSFSRIKRILTVGIGAVAAIFSVGYFLGKLTRLKRML